MRGHYFVPYSEMIKGQYVVWRPALKGVQVFNSEVVLLVPLQLKSRPVVYESLQLRLVQQVEDLLLVYLQVGAVHCELLLLQSCLLANHFKQQLDGSRNYSFVVPMLNYWLRNPLLVCSVLVTLHCESLA